jgi:hypothetical protein
VSRVKVSPTEWSDEGPRVAVGRTRYAGTLVEPVPARHNSATGKGVKAKNRDYYLNHREAILEKYRARRAMAVTCGRIMKTGDSCARGPGHNPRDCKSRQSMDIAAERRRTERFEAA